MTQRLREFSFPRLSRLGGRRAFAPVFAFRCVLAGAFVQVYAKPSDHPRSRLGISVNKSLVPQATARNYCKRLAREAFRAARAKLSGTDVVVRFSCPVTPACAAQARGEIIDLMERAREASWARADASRQR